MSIDTPERVEETAVPENPPQPKSSLFPDFKRVLLVEDDISLEPFWSYTLWEVDPDLHMIWAQNAEEAVKALVEHEKKGQPISLVISDIFLSNRKTGLDLLDDCHEKLGDNVPPFIIVSSVSRNRYMDLRDGKDQLPPYLKKPLDLYECVPLISSLIKG